MQKIANDIIINPELTALLVHALVDNPPMLIRDGGVIKTGFDAIFDELSIMSQNANEKLNELELREKTRTGLSSLKIGYNRVQGFYIELSKGQANKVPHDYKRQRTLKNTERYTTYELKIFEEEMLLAQVKARAREKWLYENLLSDLLNYLLPLQKLAAALSLLDVLTNLAERAQNFNWCR